MVEQTPAEFIEGKIRAAFTEVAEMVNDGRIEVGEDFTPMTIFDAENALLRCWRAYVERRTSHD